MAWTYMCGLAMQGIQLWQTLCPSCGIRNSMMIYASQCLVAGPSVLLYMCHQSEGWSKQPINARPDRSGSYADFRAVK